VWFVVTFCSGFSARHLVRALEQGWRTAFGLSKDLKIFQTPFQSRPGQMAAFVTVLRSKAKDALTAKNEYKQVETRSHSMFVAILHNIVPCGDWGRWGKASPFSPDKQQHRAWPLCAKVSRDESFDLSVAPRIAFMASSCAFHSTAWPPCQLSLKPCHLATDSSSSHESHRETPTREHADR
jgi:hypothetical protein